jgi:hypothetical protein
MAQGTKQGLDEVKLTLQRLQRIALETGDGEELAMKAGPMPSPEPKPEPKPRNRTAVEAAPPAPPVVETPPAAAAGRRYVAFGAAGLAALAGMAGVAAWKFSDMHRKPPPTAAIAVDAPVRPSTPSLPASGLQENGIAQAERLLDAGSVTQARVLLEDLALRSPEAALMMARSYDPNYLKQLSDYDAAPDIVEAERWYRAWHAIAGQNGLAMEADRLERIIKSMK